MRSVDEAGRTVQPDIGSARGQLILDPTQRRDRFRATVAALDPGPLREVLTAVAYAVDEAARTAAAAAPPDRWHAVVAAAERAAHAAAHARRPDATGPHRIAA